MEDKGKGTERWNGAIANLTEMASNLDSLQKFLLKKAVFVDEETFAKASLTSEQARTIKFRYVGRGSSCFGIGCKVIQQFMYHKSRNLILTHGCDLLLRKDGSVGAIFDQVLEQRIESLERELDAAITAAARARTEKRQAEAAQKAAELHAQEVTKELENTTKVFELHMEELRAKQEEISKRDKEIKVLEAIIHTLGGTESQSRNV